MSIPMYTMMSQLFLMVILLPLLNGWCCIVNISASNEQVLCVHYIYYLCMSFSTSIMALYCIG